MIPTLHDTARPLRILQVSTLDIGGGAEKVAWNLFQGFRNHGCESWLAVGTKRGDDPGVIEIPTAHCYNPWSSVWRAVDKRLGSFQKQSPSIARTRTLLRTIASPRRELESRFGVEDFHYPGTHRLLELSPERPDIVHCHNLHGGYFDPRVLPWLSRQLPVAMTLHDAWLLSGHCAHSFDCERWKSGCGHCPDLTTYPAIGRDATAYNWRRKRGIFTRSRLHIATPCKWLMEKMEASGLSHTSELARVIPYGTDLSVFHPVAKSAVRDRLRLPQDAKILIFTANGIRRNMFKDYQTMRSAIIKVAQRRKQEPLLFIALGDDAPPERLGAAEVRFVPYQKDPAVVATYYQAADIYLHAARADTFPNTVLEALACSTPVIATAVGGIPEQVKGLRWPGADSSAAHLNRYELHDATGLLVQQGDSETMAIAIEILLNDDSLRRQMSENAGRDAQNRFDVQREVNDYLEWYQELLRSIRKTQGGGSVDQEGLSM